MYGVLVALIPAFLVSLYFFDWALIVMATSVAACWFFEWAIAKFLMKKETTTICMTVCCNHRCVVGIQFTSSNLPTFRIILGALLAIGVGKMSLAG